MASIARGIVPLSCISCFSWFPIFSGSGSSRFRFVSEILPRCQVLRYASFLT